MPPLHALISVDSEFDLTEIMVDAAGAIKDRFQDTCAVDTGFMRDSADVLVAGRNKVVIIVGADYASYVEYGTHKMDAQPALGPAVDDFMPLVLTLIAKAEAEMLFKERTRFEAGLPGIAPQTLSPSQQEQRNAAIREQRQKFIKQFGRQK